jgi:hypothetical protein
LASIQTPTLQTFHFQQNTQHQNSPSFTGVTARKELMLPLLLLRVELGLANYGDDTIAK